MDSYSTVGGQYQYYQYGVDIQYSSLEAICLYIYALFRNIKKKIY
jgi:hypothetical protein